MTATPFWFGPEDRPLFGWLHTPDSGRARAGVVLCPPLAHEHQATYATLRSLAENLADRDMCALRLDYDGTGDSAGDDFDPDRVAAWLGSVRQAVSVLRQAGMTSVTLLGIRFGALLAGLVAEQDKGLEGLVLWDPVTSGRSYLAEQRLLASRTFNTPSSRRDGSLEIPGMTLEATTVAHIRALDLSRGAGALAPRALVLQRADQTLEALKARLDGSGADWAEAPGQADLIEKGWAAGILAHETNRVVAEWLCEVAPSRPVPVTATVRRTGATVARTTGGAPIVETPVFLGKTGLFGILTETPGNTSSTTAVFLNVANGPRIGACRLWVDWARRWAAVGVRCFRMDLSGMGDSPVRHEGQPSLTLRAPEHLDDVAEACSFLSPDDPSDVVLVGLCTSGYQVLESGLALKPRGVVAVNPITYFRPPEKVRGLPRDHRRRIALNRNVNTFDDRARAYYRTDGPGPSTARGLGGYPRLDRWLHSTKAPRLRAARSLREGIRVFRTGLAWRLQVIVAPDRRPSRWLSELVDNDVDVFLVCSKRDARMILFGLSKRLLSRLTQTGNFWFSCIPELEHSNFISERRSLVGDMVEVHIAARFGLPPATALRDVRELAPTQIG
ncbi:MAG TPA: hypothetical protein VEJ84_17655 [Acidimicrobiales bacterium]|nr:hypothetical protein [Acidimicrobiales bacterium]